MTAGQYFDTYPHDDEPEREELARGLRELADGLVPNERYELSIDGAALPVDVVMALEVATSYAINSDWAAKIDLDYDIVSAKLHIDSLTIKLDKAGAWMRIVDTKKPTSYGYTSVIVDPEHTSVAQERLSIDSAIIDRIQSYLRLTHPPTDNPYAYRLWLAERVDKPQGYHTRERMTVFDNVTGYGTYGMLIERTQVVNQEDAYEASSLTFSVNVGTPAETVVHQETLQLNESIRPEPHNDMTASYSQFTIKQHPFVGNHEDITHHKYKQVVIDDGRIEYFSKLLAIAKKEKESWRQHQDKQG